MLHCEMFPNFHHSWLWYANRLIWLTSKQANGPILIIMEKEDLGPLIDGVAPW